VDTQLIELTTGSRRVTDLSPHARRFVQGRGDGLLHVFVPHATAGLALFELGAGSDDDLDEVLDRLLPRDDRYLHRHGSPGHGADHLVPVLVSPSITVPVTDGELLLGTWQSLALIDTNVDNPRRTVRLSFLPG
jgi:secondary thiamine-phosphate synthase enzyme